MGDVTAPSAPARRIAGLTAAFSLDELRVRTAALVAIAVVAFVLRIAWVLYADARPSFENDGGLYHSIAQSIADGDGFTSPFGAPTAYLPPAYPALMAVALKLGGGSLTAGHLLNALLGTAGAVALYVFARTSLRPAPALAAAAIYALLPSQIIATAVFFPDALTVLFLLVGLAAFARTAGDGSPAYAIASGLLLGAATLSQAQMLLYPVLLAIVLVVRDRRRIVSGVILVVAAAIVVTPWCVRNQIVVGDPGPVATHGGVAFWIGHHNGATGLVRRPDALRAAVDDGRDLDDLERETNRRGYRDGLEYAFTHPGQEFADVWKRLFWTFGDDEEWMQLNENHGANEWLDVVARDPWFTLSNLYYYAILALAAIGVGLTRPWREPALWAPLLFGLYWIGLHALFYGDPRFHTAIMPVAALFAAIALCSVAPVLWSPRRVAPED